MVNPSRNWMFTVFFADNDGLSAEECALYWAEARDHVFSDPIFKYVIFNVEKAPTTGGIHWQGYCELMRPCRITYLKERHELLHSAHFEPRLGTQEEAIAYCSKPDTRIADTFYELGQRSPGQGYRSDMESLAEMVKAGKSQRDIAVEMPGMYIRFHNGIAAMEAVLADELPPETDFEPRPWQQRIIDLAAAQPDDRTII